MSGMSNMEAPSAGEPQREAAGAPEQQGAKRPCFTEGALRALRLKRAGTQRGARGIASAFQGEGRGVAIYGANDATGRPLVASPQGKKELAPLEEFLGAKAGGSRRARACDKETVEEA